MLKFDNWPENLPREDLIRLLRGYAKECHYVEQIIADVIPEDYPLTDWEPGFPADGILPAQERAIGDATPTSMAMHAASKIRDLQKQIVDRGV